MDGRTKATVTLSHIINGIAYWTNGKIDLLEEILDIFRPECKKK